LTPEEGRVILGQLYELQSRRAEVSALREYIARDRAQDEQERATFAAVLETEREATRLTGSERDLMREKAQLYESLYRAITRKPSFGCRTARAVTIGLYRCR
jgi:hypothetical protein